MCVATATSGKKRCEMAWHRRNNGGEFVVRRALFYVEG